MPQPIQQPNTAAIEIAKYSPSPASQVVSAPVTDTIVVTTDIRTVVTRAKQGTLKLRYTPRDPSPSSSSTSP